jgi:glycosyltransferase involved in cell wall biosynthesis
VSDSVRDGVDGIVVPRTGDAAADAQGLADGIIGLLGDPEQRQRMADAGASGRHRFDLENRIRELVDLYGEELARR